jgi:2-polyprenyl-6-methoxyphenol hydroxylase-like FAD-dependent oxidoreductase
MTDTKIAVIGAGLIGRAWSIAFARAGCEVSLWDPVDGVAAATIAALPPSACSTRPVISCVTSGASAASRLPRV